MVEVVMSMYLSPISTTIPPMMVGSVWDRGVGEGDKNERERERGGDRGSGEMREHLCKSVESCNTD